LNANGPKFLLEDVFGARYTGTLGGKVQGEEGAAIISQLGEHTSEAWRSSWSYLSPADDGVRKVIWPQKELSFPGPMLRAAALPGAQVLATVTLPFAPPSQGRPIGSRFGAIHSNPPSPTPGTSPGIIVNRFGKGTAIWVSAPIEISSEAVNVHLVAALLKRELPGPYIFELETHPSVEMTLFHQKDKRRMLASLLTMQEQLPAFPVSAKVRVQVRGKVNSVMHLTEGKVLKFQTIGPYCQFELEPFTSLSMAMIEYA
jgi:hypothetical protein